MGTVARTKLYSKSVEPSQSNINDLPVDYGRRLRRGRFLAAISAIRFGGLRRTAQ